MSQLLLLIATALLQVVKDVVAALNNMSSFLINGDSVTDRCLEKFRFFLRVVARHLLFRAFNNLIPRWYHHLCCPIIMLLTSLLIDNITTVIDCLTVFLVIELIDVNLVENLAMQCLQH